MKQIEIFDPALCCSTGICGPSVDPKLVQAAADLDALKNQGISVKRFNLAQDLDAFAGNDTVKALIAANGIDILPVTLVDGVVCKEREYPTMAEFQDYLNSDNRSGAAKRPSFRSIEWKPKNSGCCGDDSSCC